MAIDEALTFLREARRDEELRRELEALDDDATLESLVDIAGRAGLRFTVGELERAYALDWKMRWARYGAARPG